MVDAAGRGGPLGILLVDDHRENLAALRAVLEPLGERLVSAESGEQALRVLLREEIAVILLDVRMAGSDGLETARIIRARPRTRHIPIIFLTAQATDVEEIALAYATGAVDYVIKPFEPEILRAKVSVFVELSRERAERVRQSQARAEAEAVARTVRTLQILSDAALSHLEMGGLTAELLERAATLFQADAACLLLRDENAPGLGVHAGRGALPVPADGRVMLGDGTFGRLAVERRAALLVGDELPPADTVPVGQLADHQAPIACLLVVPLVTSDELLGLLVLGATAGDRFDAGDLELLMLAADRMAIAIDHVQRFAHGRELVETLQRSLLPDRLPHHPRLELAARYLPSGLAPQIGGDWYDALELDGDRTAVMIGDVVGHGVRAATTMSELRNALRAFAVEGHGPGAALHQLDRVVHATFGPGMIATVLFLIIDATKGTVTISRAGHPPPALRSADGEMRFLETGSTLPLGIDDRISADEAEYAVQRRRHAAAVHRRPGRAPPRVDHHRLRSPARRLHQRARGRRGAVRLRAGAHGDRAGQPRRHRGAGRPRPRPAAGRAGARARRPRPRRSRWRATACGCGSTTTCPSSTAWPAATWSWRGLRRAPTSSATPTVPRDATFQASAARDGDAVALQVRDTGRWRPPRGQHGGRGIALMRELCDEVQVDRRPEGTTVLMRRGFGDPASDARPES